MTCCPSDIAQSFLEGEIGIGLGSRRSMFLVRRNEREGETQAFSGEGRGETELTEVTGGRG